MVFKRRSKIKKQLPSSSIESPIDVLLSHLITTIQSYLQKETSLQRVSESLEASLHLIQQKSDNFTTPSSAAPLSVIEIADSSAERHVIHTEKDGLSTCTGNSLNHLRHGDPSSVYQGMERKSQNSMTDKMSIHSALSFADYPADQHCSDNSLMARDSFRTSSELKINQASIIDRGSIHSTLDFSSCKADQYNNENRLNAIDSSIHSSFMEFPSAKTFKAFVNSTGEENSYKSHNVFQQFKDARCIRKLSTIPYNQQGKLPAFSKKSLETTQFLKNVLATIPPFQPYLNHVNLFVKAMQRKVFEIGEVVNRPNNICTYFSIIEQGRVAFRTEQGLQTHDGGRGDVFGANAITTNAPNKSFAIVTDTLIVYRINLLCFRAIMDEAISFNAKVFTMLNAIPLFQNLGAKQISEVVSGMKIESYKDGETIIDDGQPNNSLYVVSKGIVTINRSKPIDITENVSSMKASTDHDLSPSIQKLISGQYFGEQSMLTNKTHDGIVIARSSKVEVFVISRDLLPYSFGQRMNLVQLKSIRCILVSHWSKIMG